MQKYDPSKSITRGEPWLMEKHDPSATMTHRRAWSIEMYDPQKSMTHGEACPTEEYDQHKSKTNRRKWLMKMYDPQKSMIHGKVCVPDCRSSDHHYSQYAWILMSCQIQHSTCCSDWQSYVYSSLMSWTCGVWPQLHLICHPYFSASSASVYWLMSSSKTVVSLISKSCVPPDRIYQIGQSHLSSRPDACLCSLQSGIATKQLIVQTILNKRKIVHGYESVHELAFDEHFNQLIVGEPT